MSEDLTFEVPAQNTSHWMFLTPELMRETFPDKRDRHEFKKLILGMAIPNTGGTTTLGKHPRNHASTGQPSKSNRQKYARRARRRAE